MEIKEAKYGKNPMGVVCCINCIINGKNCSVPISIGNTEYDEIKKQVDAGTLTVADAD